MKLMSERGEEGRREKQCVGIFGPVAKPVDRNVDDFRLQPEYSSAFRPSSALKADQILKIPNMSARTEVAFAIKRIVLVNAKHPFELLLRCLNVVYRYI